MAQINLYVDNGTLKKISQAAKREHKSISKWVCMRLAIALERTWPEGYFDLFGSLADPSFTRPNQPDFSKDIPRKDL